MHQVACSRCNGTFRAPLECHSFPRRHLVGVRPTRVVPLGFQSLHRGEATAAGGAAASGRTERSATETLTADDASGIDVVLELWFGPWAVAAHKGEVAPAARLAKSRAWFKKSDEFDSEVRERLGALHERAAAGELAAWEGLPRGALALAVLLDQVPRNCHRGSPASYAQDAAALAVARRAVERGYHRQLSPVEATFLCLPFEHSEDMAAQHASVALFEDLARDKTPDWSRYLHQALDSARRHRDIVSRFGRFPHRNAVLGRESTPEEAEFLQQPNSSF